MAARCILSPRISTTARSLFKLRCRYCKTTPNKTLAARVLREEHHIYPQAIRWLCKNEIKLDAQSKVVFSHRKQSGFALIYPGLE
jgi:hypothetical protein